MLDGFIETGVVTRQSALHVRAGDFDRDCRPELLVAEADAVTIMELAASCFPRRRGDADGNGRLNIADAVLIVHHVFAGRRIPCADSADVNGDGAIEAADALALLQGLFLGRPLQSVPVACPLAWCDSGGSR